MVEKKANIPPCADRFLRWYCDPDLLEEVQGDVYEMFDREVVEIGERKAKRRFVWRVMRFFNYSTISGNRSFDIFIFQQAMYIHYIRSSWRYLSRHKHFTMLNIVGLTVGLVSSIFIGLWVHDEMTFDQFLDESDQVYLVRTNFFTGEELETWYTSARPLAALVDSVIPEVEVATNMYGYESVQTVGKGNIAFKERGAEAEENLFEVLPYPFLQGNPQVALVEPKSIVITETLADKLYGANWESQNIIGSSLTLDRQAIYQLTGIIQDIPLNASQQFSFILSYDQSKSQRQSQQREWDDINYRTYVKIPPSSDVATVEQRINKLYQKNMEETFPGDINWENGDGIFLQAYHDMHLYGQFENGQVKGGRIHYVFLLGAVACLIVLMACINYMNLSTAQSIKRAKEIGVRKVIGAHKKQLIIQFIFEAWMITGLAFFLAILVVELLIPQFNIFFQKSVNIPYQNPLLISGILGSWGILGLLAGSYPAFFLSSFQPKRMLQGGLQTFSHNILVRKALVVVQFTISMIIIVSSLGIYFQLSYIEHKSLGFNRDYVLYRDLSDEEKDKREAFEQELKSVLGTDNITFGSSNMLHPDLRSSAANWEGKDSRDMQIFDITFIDDQFLSVMDIELIEGRNFSSAYGRDSTNFIINESAARIMGMQHPVGQPLALWQDWQGRIIGVVKDFHQNSLHVPIAPMILCYRPELTNYLFVKSSADHLQSSIETIEKVYDSFQFGAPLSLEFLDQEFAKLYVSEQTFSKLSFFATILSLFISCLGLFGLSLYAAETRNKEMSIRKVLGASMTQIVLLFLKDYVQLIVISILIAIPLGVYLLDLWLNQYAYKIDVGPYLFVIGGAALSILSIIVLAYQAIRTAITNPVEYLHMD